MYPRLVIDTQKFIHNIKALRKKLDQNKISFMLITKCFCAMPELTRLADNYVDFFGDSRIENVIKMKGLTKPKALIRIPMLSEVRDVVEYADISFNSEVITVAALNKAAETKGIVHKVIVMRDLGDLREGYYLDTDFFDAIAQIVLFKNIEIAGIAVNLTCYGAVLPTAEIMTRLSQCARDAEERFGVGMKIISGGNSSSLPLLDSGKMPEGINNLRLGESVICGKETAYGEKYPNMWQDVFSIESEIIEMKEKPSVPEGETGVNAFGDKPRLVDRGIRRRAILAVGKQDIDYENIRPADDRIVILGGSSDHLIVDLHDTGNDYDVGGIVRFYMDYPSILRACTSDYVKKFFIT